VVVIVALFLFRSEIKQLDILLSVNIGKKSLN